MRFIKISLLLFCIHSLTSCIPHPAFVASSYEPLLVSKKKEVQVSLGLRPLRYAFADVSYALTNHLALRLSGGGFVGLGNLTASALYYKNYNKISVFGGGLFNYQSNQIKRTFGYLGTSITEYHYSCVYQSPGLVMGINLNRNKQIQNHFNIKAMYNMVSSYNYYYQKEDRYKNYDLENLHYQLKDFLSLEPSYSLIVGNEGSKHLYKMQIGFNLSQKTLKHNYIAGPGTTYYGYDYNAQSHSKLHPVTSLVNVSFSYIFYSHKD